MSTSVVSVDILPRRDFLTTVDHLLTYLKPKVPL